MGADSDIFRNAGEYLPADPAFEDIYKATPGQATLMLH
jgi:hypothetical protein